MPQSVRPDEQAAADLVSTVIGVALHFTGGDGGIDFAGEGAGQRVILEVTRNTRPQLRRDELAAVAHKDDVRHLACGRSWFVSYLGYPRYQGLADRMSGPLRQLEIHGISEYDSTLHAWWMRQAPTLVTAIDALTEERVGHARVFPTADPDAAPRLFVSTIRGFNYGGPDAGLSSAESYVREEGRHLAKTVAEPADERHLFVWSDVATDESFARALRSTWPALPTRAPQLDDRLDHLWLVDEPTGQGWHWSRKGWEAVKAPPGTTA